MNRKTLAIAIILSQNKNGSVIYKAYPSGRTWGFRGHIFATGKEFKSFLKKEGLKYKHLYIKQEELI